MHATFHLHPPPNFVLFTIRSEVYIYIIIKQVLIVLSKHKNIHLDIELYKRLKTKNNNQKGNIISWENYPPLSQ